VLVVSPTEGWALARESGARSHSLVTRRKEIRARTQLRVQRVRSHARLDSVGVPLVLKIAMNYQQPELEIVRDAINSRHTLPHTAQNTN